MPNHAELPPGMHLHVYSYKQQINAQCEQLTVAQERLLPAHVEHTQPHISMQAPDQNGSDHLTLLFAIPVFVGATCWGDLSQQGRIQLTPQCSADAVCREEILRVARGTVTHQV